MTPRRQRRALLRRRPSRRETCDFWQATLPNAQLGLPLVPLHRHRRHRTAYYGDDTPRRRRPRRARPRRRATGAMRSPSTTRRSRRPPWMKNAVDLPDLPGPLPQRPTRQRPEDRATCSYHRPRSKLLWSALPEGYCRGYATPCPPPPYPAATALRPKSATGRDYYGGDLKGVDQSLELPAACRAQHHLPQPDLRRRLGSRLRYPELLQRSIRSSARRRSWEDLR